MILLIFRVLSFLPLSILQMFGRLGGRLVYALPGRYRQRLQANARQAGYPDAAFARRAAAETGAMIMELPWVWLRTEDCFKRIIDEQEEVFTLARQLQKPVLFLTPHLGNFEITGRYGAIHLPLTVMFRPPRKAALAPLMKIARQGTGITAVPANMSGVRSFLKALKQGQSVGMLPDQVPREGDGVWAPFFGKPAWTVTLPGKLATATHPMIYVAACERLPHGRGWKMHYTEVKEPIPDDPVAQATLFNRHMEAMIRKFPEQYLWGYHRYKRPSAAPPPPDESDCATEPTHHV